jgi:hypothetical protein
MSFKQIIAKSLPLNITWVVKFMPVVRVFIPAVNTTSAASGSPYICNATVVNPREEEHKQPITDQKILSWSDTKVKI